MESYSHSFFLSGASLLVGISGSSAFRRCGNLSAAFWLFVSLWVFVTEGILLRPIQDELVSFNRRILEHKASSACLTVNPDEYKLVLDNCDWDSRKAAEIEGTFSIVPSNPGGHLLRWTNGPKPSGTEACLSFPQEEDSQKKRDDKNEDILLSECDSRSPAQNWHFQRIPDSPGDERLFLIRKYGYESKCLGVNTEDNSFQLISKGPCNDEDPDQVWKICGTLTDTSLCNSD